MLVVGFYRDFLFKNINALMQAWDAEMDYQMPSSLNFLKNYEYNTLSWFKWVLTVAFSVIYLLISIVVVRLFFNEKIYSRITIITFCGVLLLSLFFMLMGYVFKGGATGMYSIARYLMGMAQSPVLLMILVPAFKLSKKDQ